jgi:hypothetical protein
MDAKVWAANHQVISLPDELGVVLADDPRLA